MANTEETLSFDDHHVATALFGPMNAHLTHLASLTKVELTTCGTSLTVSGTDARVCEALLNVFTQFYSMARTGHSVSAHDLEQGLHILLEQPSAHLADIFQGSASLTLPRKKITARNAMQRRFLEQLRHTEMHFAVGPAGTGKTYLTVAMAVHMLTERKVKRLVLVRPAVEAGEKLGFLPGDLSEKVNPYLRPLYDALHEMLGPQKVASLIETNIIEVAPLAFMRGRTLNDAYIILDEAQNTTREQMKMFLTRMGFGSRAVITGDVTQIDLPSFAGEDATARSGLVHALQLLTGVKGIGFTYFSGSDVVRHPLVGRIVHAYDKSEHFA